MQQLQELVAVVAALLDDQITEEDRLLLQDDLVTFKVRQSYWMEVDFAKIASAQYQNHSFSSFDCVPRQCRRNRRYA